jgi:hypothetical protein
MLRQDIQQRLQGRVVYSKGHAHEASNSNSLTGRQQQVSNPKVIPLAINNALTGRSLMRKNSSLR